MIMKVFWKFSLVQYVFDLRVHCFCKAEVALLHRQFIQFAFSNQN